MTLGIPPDVFPSRPAIHHLERGTPLVRIYDPRRGGWKHRRRFGPLSDLRWDHHEPPPRMHRTRSVWYAATRLRGAIGEVFGRLGFVDGDSRLRIAVVRVAAPLDVVDLVGVAARRIGLTQEIATTTEYEACRRWARSIYEQYPAVGGLRWRGRETGSICIVLNDRASDSSLALVSDHEIREAAVWPRVARAARQLKLRIV